MGNLWYDNVPGWLLFRSFPARCKVGRGASFNIGITYQVVDPPYIKQTRCNTAAACAACRASVDPKKTWQPIPYMETEVGNDPHPILQAILRTKEVGSLFRMAQVALPNKTPPSLPDRVGRPQRLEIPRLETKKRPRFQNQATKTHSAAKRMRVDPPRGRTWNLLIRSQTLCH